MAWVLTIHLVYSKKLPDRVSNLPLNILFEDLPLNIPFEEIKFILMNLAVNF